MDDLVKRLEYHAERGDSPICYEAAAEIRSLREQVDQWAGCATYDATMEGPVFKGWDRSALDRCRKRHEDKEPRV